MNPSLGIALATAVFAVSCSGSGPSGVIERRASAGDADVPDDHALCAQIETFALGSHAGDDLTAVIDELGRLAALFDVGAALPHLQAWRAAIDDGTSSAAAMDTAAELIDTATFDECGVPAFTAMYVSTSFASCFGRAPIEAGSLAPDTVGCETGETPTFLPCFDETNGRVPVDCRTGATVVVRAGTWVDANEATTG